MAKFIVSFHGSEEIEANDEYEAMEQAGNVFMSYPEHFMSVEETYEDDKE